MQHIEQIASTLSRGWTWAAGRWARGKRGCRRRSLGCLVVFLLLFLLACGLLLLAISQVSAAAPEPPEPPGASAEALLVYLLIDNSNSMFEKDGVGSDPGLLRLAAARLFISYLGVDSGDVIHYCSVIFFGREAEIVIPLTPLRDDGRRAQMLALLQDPPRLGWTDQAAALALARTALASDATAGQPAVVLLTDGKPEWTDGPTPAEREAYAARLRREGERLAAAGIPLFIILLANEATDADAEIAATWQPLWQQMAQATPPGHFYLARQATELTAIYHDVVVALTSSHTAGPVVQGQVGAAGLRQSVAVEPDLARLTFVVSKSRPGIRIVVIQPNGAPLTGGQAGVGHAGLAGDSLAEVWVVDNPLAGNWTVWVSGEGEVTVWKDYRPALPTATPPPTMTPIATATTAHTPSLTATAGTPMPTSTTIATPTPDLPGPQGLAGLPVNGSPGAPVPLAWGFIPRYWPWLMALLAVGGLGVYGGYRQWQRRQPIVEGELRLLSGPGFVTDETTLELDRLARREVTVGAAPADVPIVGAAHQFIIRPGPPLDGNHPMLIRRGDSPIAPAGLLLDGKPLLGEQPLHDAAVLTIGDTRLRYDNLRLRSAEKSNW